MELGNPDAPFLTKDDINMLKDYVQAGGGTTMAESTIALHVTHSNLSARLFEIRLDKHVSDKLMPVHLRIDPQPFRCPAR
jgi:tubulin-folding cofactor B